MAKGGSKINLETVKAKLQGVYRKDPKTKMGGLRFVNFLTRLSDDPFKEAIIGIDKAALKLERISRARKILKLKED